MNIDQLFKSRAITSSEGFEAALNQLDFFDFIYVGKLLFFLLLFFCGFAVFILENAVLSLGDNAALVLSDGMVITPSSYAPAISARVYS